MRYWDHLMREYRNDMEIIVDKTWEETDVGDCFDDTCYEIQEMRDKINHGRLDWFMLRARVFVEGLEVSSAYLGGCLYEDAREVLTDGTAEDLIYQAIEDAKPRFYSLSRVFSGLSTAVDLKTI